MFLADFWRQHTAPCIHFYPIILCGKYLLYFPQGHFIPSLPNKFLGSGNVTSCLLGFMIIDLPSPIFVRVFRTLIMSHCSTYIKQMHWFWLILHRRRWWRRKPVLRTVFTVLQHCPYFRSCPCSCLFTCKEIVYICCCCLSDGPRHRLPQMSLRCWGQLVSDRLKIVPVIKINDLLRWFEMPQHDLKLML